MAQSKLPVAILVVSDSVASGETKDSSVDGLAAILEREGEWVITDQAVVADDILQIQTAIRAWTDSPTTPPALILTVGGTGFSRRDVTGEAVSVLLQKHAPGLVIGMVTDSLKVTPYAMMSRPVAGVRNQTVIVTLPGSPKGSRENLDAVVKVLSHACAQVGVDSSRELHQRMQDVTMKEGKLPEQDALVGKVDMAEGGESSKHATPTGGAVHTGTVEPTNRPSVAARARQSEWKAIHFREAEKYVGQIFDSKAIQTELRPVDENLVGYVVADDVLSKEQVPVCNVSIMDGYALARSVDEGVQEFVVRNVSHANSGVPEMISGNEAVRVTTGAPIPPGTECVVKVEDTTVSKTTDEFEEAVIRVNRRVCLYANIRRVGSDCGLKTVLLRKGDNVHNIATVGTLLSVGVREVKVYRRPTVGIICTGNELVPPTTPGPLKPGQVRDTNGICLLGLCRQFGYEASAFNVVNDSEGEIEAGLRQALAKCDIVVTSGGASMGETDLVKQVIQKRFDSSFKFGRVMVKPGLPTAYAEVQVRAQNDPKGGRVSKPVFCLPGNPASSLAMFYALVLPKMQLLAGYTEPFLPRIHVDMEDPFEMDLERTELQRVVVYYNPYDTAPFLRAHSTGLQRSSRLGSFAQSNGLLVVEPKSDQPGEPPRFKAEIVILTGPIQTIAF